MAKRPVKKKDLSATSPQEKPAELSHADEKAFKLAKWEEHKREASRLREEKRLKDELQKKIDAEKRKKDWDDSSFYNKFVSVASFVARAVIGWGLLLLFVIGVLVKCHEAIEKTRRYDDSTERYMSACKKQGTSSARCDDQWDEIQKNSP